MDRTAQKVLITQAGTLLGFRLAKLFLQKNQEVFGVGTITPPSEVLNNSHYTHLDIDLSQPLPSNIPQFDLIVHLLTESTESLKNFSTTPKLTPVTNKIVSYATHFPTQVILLAPVNTPLNFYDSVAKNDQIKQNLKLLLIGDIYGPNDPLTVAGKSHSHVLKHHTHHFYFNNELSNLITQAILSDKIILEDEGMKVVFPTFIDDAISAFEHFLKDSNSKNIQTLISESPRSALTCAYSIQKIAQISFNKQLKLYFSGPEKKIAPEPQPDINLTSLEFKPQYNLEAGLKKTFENYQGQKGNTTYQTDVNSSTAQRLDQRVSKIHSDRLDQSKFPNITSRIPKPSIGFNTKKIILAILIIIMLTIAKTGLDSYLAVTSLEVAKDSLFAGDFKKADQKAISAAKSFKAAENKLTIITKPFSFVIPTQINILISAVSGAQSASVATSSFTKASGLVFKNLATVASNSSKDEAVNFEEAEANLKLAHRKFTESYLLANLAQKSDLVSKVINSSAETYQKLATLSLQAHELVSFVPEIVGSTDQKSYLLLIQYNSELRPGGGFIGTVGEITFENGRLKNYSFEDVYTIDSKLEEVIKPPAPVGERLGLDKLYLRDSNFSLDFLANSTTARDLYQKETARSFDGVIAFDLTFIENLLKVTGPVHVKSLDDVVSEENFPDKLLSYSKLGQSQNFLPELTTALINQLIKSFTGNFEENRQATWLTLAETISGALTSKHLLLQFDNEDLDKLVKIKGWNNPLPPLGFDPADEEHETRDFLAISEANLGANRANRYLDRKIDYQVEIDDQSIVNSTLKITYKNNSRSTTWPEGTYINYLRVYAPFAATITAYQNGETISLEEVEVTTQGNLTAFSTFVEVQPGTTRNITLSYRIPKGKTLAQAPTYHLYIQKQPGTEKDPLSFTLNLPEGFKIESINNEEASANQQSTRIDTDLSIDRQFEIEIAEK